MGRELWFRVAVCDYHWRRVAGDREPVRLPEQDGKVLDRCAKCGDELTSPIYVRASWRYQPHPEIDYSGMTG